MNISDRYKLMPNRISVTYYTSSVDGMSAGKTIKNAESRPSSLDDTLLIGGGGKGKMRTFFLWAAMLGTIRPQQGDRLKDNKGDTYGIELVKEELNDQRIRLICLLNR